MIFNKLIKLAIVLVFSCFSVFSYASCGGGLNVKVIGKITIDQEPFMQTRKTRMVPMALWNGLNKAFASLVYKDACIETTPFRYHSDDGETKPLKPVKKKNHSIPNLVTEFYDNFDSEGEDFLSDQLELQGNKMSMLIFWDTVFEEDVKEGFETGILEVMYTVYDLDNEVQTPFFIELELPMTSRKQALETVSTQIFNHIKNIKEQIFDQASE